VLILFFGMSLAYDEAREVADGSQPMLKQSWPIGQCGVAANGALMLLMDYVSKNVVSESCANCFVLESLFSF
jgi:hypothetical protein